VQNVRARAAIHGSHRRQNRPDIARNGRKFKPNAEIGSIVIPDDYALVIEIN